METGLKFDNTKGSRLGFLRRGLTTACLKAAGTVSNLGQELIKTRRLGPTVLKTIFSTLAVTISNGQFVGFRISLRHQEN